MIKYTDDFHAGTGRQHMNGESVPVSVRSTDGSSVDPADMMGAGYTGEYVLTAEKLAELIRGLRKDPFFRLSDMEDYYDDKN